MRLPPDVGVGDVILKVVHRRANIAAHRLVRNEVVLCQWALEALGFDANIDVGDALYSTFAIVVAAAKVFDGRPLIGESAFTKAALAANVKDTARLNHPMIR